jgi:glycosyltransferase involved in cell wall biosynthesis
MRMFIDCSYIDFSRQPTGIPRVVLQYIECGYRWSRETGIPVIPVVTTPAGLVPVRPVPGLGKPDYLRQFDADGIETAETELELEKAAFHLQAALVASGHLSRSTRCAQDIRQLFDALSAEAKVMPFDVGRGDVLFCPAYWHDVPPTQFAALQRQGCKVAILVHDILPVTFAKFYQAPWKHEFEANLVAAMRSADALYAVSNYTADSMRELAERKGIQGLPVTTSYNGYASLVSEELRTRIAAGSFSSVLGKTAAHEFIRAANPFIMVGSVEPKKGHIPTIRSFEALWDAGLERPLVIIGRKGWLEESVVHSIRTSPQFNKRLFWFEDFDDLDLAFTYHHARGLVFASYAEGFGIPMIEALSAGVPVVAYRTPINSEVLGKYGLMFDDFASFARHIMALDTAPGFEAARGKVSDFAWPGWDEIATSLFNGLAAKFALAKT